MPTRYMTTAEWALNLCLACTSVGVHLYDNCFEERVYRFSQANPWSREVKYLRPKDDSSLIFSSLFCHTYLMESGPPFTPLLTPTEVTLAPPADSNSLNQLLYAELLELRKASANKKRKRELNEQAGGPDLLSKVCLISHKSRCLHNILFKQEELDAHLYELVYRYWYPDSTAISKSLRFHLEHTKKFSGPEIEHWYRPRKKKVLSHMTTLVLTYHILLNCRSLSAFG
jgi:hypothetical protein